MSIRLFPQKDFVEYVKEVLTNADYEFRRYKFRSNAKDIGTHDLIFYDTKKLTIVKVLNSYSLRADGTMSSTTRKQLGQVFSDLIDHTFKSVLDEFGSKADKIEIEKIIVVKNKQVFNEYSEILKRYSKTKSHRNTDVKLMLIRYPIIRNSFATKECGNEVFTVSQLVEAIKSGIVKLKNIPSPLQNYMVSMLRSHGYHKFKANDEFRASDKVDDMK